METAIKKLEERIIESHLNNGSPMGEIKNPSRRNFLKGLLSAGIIASTPFGYAIAQEREQRISDEARNRIWANYPEMRDVIDMINEDENLRGTGRTMSQFIEYALYPDQGISNRENIAITTRKVPIEDMDTPHYWLLLKIREGDEYNFVFVYRGDSTSAEVGAEFFLNSHSEAY